MQGCVGSTCLFFDMCFYKGEQACGELQTVLAGVDLCICVCACLLACVMLCCVFMHLLVSTSMCISVSKRVLCV